MTGRLQRYGVNVASFFCFRERGTTLQTELIAGLSTFLALTPSFILIPAVLSKSGLDSSAVLFAVIVAGSLATMAMGLYANLPFAVSVGIETAGFFAFVVCGNLHMSWQDGLGAVFISGLLCLLFTALRVRKDIIKAIPSGLKTAIGTSVGVFVATIGPLLANIITFKGGIIDYHALSATSLGTSQALVLYAGLVLCVIFGSTRLKFPGGMLLAIIVSAGICALLGIKADAPAQISSQMTNAVGQLHLNVVADPRFWSPILVFFIIDFVGGIGKFIGLLVNTDIHDREGNVPHLSRALYVDGAGTILGSLLGCSSLIAFVESAVGIKAGGRTGLTALVCGIFMAASIVLTPLMQWIPSQAITGVLLFVGYLLLPGVGKGATHLVMKPFDVVIALVMGGVSFLTFSLDKSLAIGFWAYFLQSMIVQGQSNNQRFWLGSIATLLTVTIIWQYWVT